LIFKEEINPRPPITNIEKRDSTIPQNKTLGEKKIISPFHSFIFIVTALTKMLKTKREKEYIMPEKNLPKYIDSSERRVANNVSKVFDVRSRISEFATGPTTMKQLNQAQ
jgi:hypothetical protein